MQQLQREEQHQVGRNTLTLLRLLTLLHLLTVLRLLTLLLLLLLCFIPTYASHECTK